MTFVKSHLIVLLMVFISGFAVMSFEMLGGRIFAPYFGSSVYIWGSLIFTFMVGLAIGYGVGGHLSIRYFGSAVLAILLAAIAAQVWIVNETAEWVLSLTFDHTEDPRTGSLVAAMVLYLVPTVTMGMVSPVAIRTVSETLHQVGSYAGTLYLVSTLGSAVGTLLTSFWLVAYFEVNTIMYANVVALLIASALGFLHHKRTKSL